MNKTMLAADFFMEIRKNLPRFLSILLIVALGVAFFSGVRASKPDMQYTAEAFYDEAHLMDLRIVSSLGLTSGDLAAVQGIDGIEDAEGVYTADALYENDGSQYVVRLRSNTEKVNQLRLTEGRLPERPGECVVDRKLADKFGIHNGDVMTVTSGTSQDLSQTVSENRFIVVGIGVSPMYLWRNRETSSIGNGTVEGFLLVQKEIFNLGAYTEIDLTVAHVRELDSFGKKYEKKVDQVKERIEKIQKDHARARYDEISKQAETELIQAEAELQDAQKELDDAKQRLDAAQAELDQAKAQINAKIQEILTGQTTVEEQEAALQESSSKLEAAKTTLDQNRANLLNNQAALNAEGQQLEAARVQLQQSWNDWTNQGNGLQAERERVSGEEQKLDQMRADLENKRGQLEELQASLQASAYERGLANGQSLYGAELSPIESTDPGETEDTPSTENPAETEEPDPTENTATQNPATEDPSQVPPQVQQLQQEIADLESDISAKESEIAEAQANIEQGQSQLDATWTELDGIGRDLDSRISVYNSAVSELTAAMSQLALGEADYAQQKATLDAGMIALQTAKQAIANGQTSINSTQAELAGAESQLAKGKEEYEKNYRESKQKMQDATRELNDRKRQLLKMEVPEWNLLDRSFIQSCESFAKDADRVGAIGNVFPLIFFLVAALVSLTSITRMVEEKRTEIGTMKALGYQRYEIAAKYICYALLASVLGGVIGLILGQTILPRVIIRAYRILYNSLPATKAPLHLWYSVSSVLVAVLCTTLAAFAACYRTLRTPPAQLMRPEAPKNGRRVFLEKWSPVWSRLNFSQKAAVRNMIRYKKRFFMTVFGIAACMALLLVGFGLKNSVTAIGKEQFGNLQKYDASISLATTDVEPVEEVEETLRQDSGVKNFQFIYRTSIDAGNKKTEKAAYLTVVEDTKSFDKYMRLKKRGSDKTYQIREDGVVITEKLARLLGVKAGDHIYLTDSDHYRVEVKITAVTENYYLHYIYMSASQYEALYGGKPEYNEILTVNQKTTEKFEKTMGEKYLALDGVNNVVFNSNTEETIQKMLKSMDLIVVVLIVSAALLCFVVLYSLNNINITERRRELASIKVLGFYDRELTMYVFRENVVLTVIGILIGMALGVLLHRFVILTAELDLIMFGRSIKWYSYLFSVLLTLAFAGFINFIMHWSLKKIRMVESLKSVE